MLDLIIRCSSIGKLMTEPKSKSEGPLSVGAKTYIRELVAQDIFSVEFEVSSKAMEKGIVCETDSIGLLNRVRGLCLEKNTERRSNKWVTGECDLFDAPGRRGHDLKTSWSISTFPITPGACEDKLYFYQMQGYMDLWDADEWEVNYCLVDTPERLIGYEPLQLHLVSHIPEHMRLTSWVVKRDQSVIDLMHTKVEYARDYYREVLKEFDRTHALPGMAESGAPWVAEEPYTPPATTAQPKAVRPITTDLELTF
jgi:hypothetical protein